MIDMLHTNLVKQLVRLMKGKTFQRVEEFQREGEEQHNAMNDDSSDDDDDDDDDEDYHVPHNWSGYDFAKLSVNEGEAVPWEYKQNEVCIGSVYANSDNMKEAIKCWSTLSLQRLFKVVKSSPRTMTCVV